MPKKQTFTCYKCNNGGIVSKSADSHGMVDEPVFTCDKCDFKLFGNFCFGFKEIKKITNKDTYLYEYFKQSLSGGKDLVYIREKGKINFGITTLKAFNKKFNKTLYRKRV